MKVALFFGSFNPITVGHMIVAHTALQDTNVDRVCFVVSPGNPSKIKKGILIDPYHRLEMAKLAIKNVDGFNVSDIEFKIHETGKPSFTHHTLKRLREDFPNWEFPILCGSDTQQMIAVWKNSNEIVLNHKTIHYPRNFTPIKLKPNSDSLKRFCEIKKNETLITAPNLDISSTYIRDRIKYGFDVTYLVPREVSNYINKHKLFQL